MGEDRIDVVLATDEAYSKPVCVVIESILETMASPSRLRVHVIDGGLERAGRDRIDRQLKKCRGEVYPLHDLPPSGLNYEGVTEHLNDATLLRLRLGDVLPSSVARVLYLDADILVNDDIGTLWNRDLGTQCVGAVVDQVVCANQTVSSPMFRLLSKHHSSQFDCSRYFNAGVMLIDMRRWRTLDISQHSISAVSLLSEHIHYLDQDVLNLLLHHDWMELAPKWNRLLGRQQIYRSSTEIRALIDESALLHFVGPMKPWRTDFPKSDLLELYRRHAFATGWNLA